MVQLVEKASADSTNENVEGQLTSDQERRDGERTGKDEGGLHIESEENGEGTTEETEGVALTVQARKDGLCKLCLPKSPARLRSSLYPTFLVTNFQVISGNMRGFGSVVCQRAPFRAVDLSFEAW